MQKGKFSDVNLSPQVLVDCVTVCVLMQCVYIHIYRCIPVSMCV